MNTPVICLKEFAGERWCTMMDCFFHYSMTPYLLHILPKADNVYIRRQTGMENRQELVANSCDLPANIISTVVGGNAQKRSKLAVNRAWYVSNINHELYYYTSSPHYV
jgi:hypothetical protein